MKELSLNILDIAQNSIKANAKNVEIKIEETEDTLTFRISDDGCGMNEDFLRQVTDPFTTTRTTRKVGLGLPLLKMEAEMTGGGISISSRAESEYEDHGTVVSATFLKNSIDFIPLGDIIGTLCVLIQGLDENVQLLFSHSMPRGDVTLSTKDLKEILGDVPLGIPEVIAWIREYLSEQYQLCGN